MDGNGIPEQLSKIGKEPLEQSFSGEYFFQSIKQRNTPVKNLLMDNHIVTGIGNIYAAESLFAAGISPLRPGNTLSLNECIELVEASRQILRDAIALGGTTIADFRQLDGSEGKFVQSLKIYGKKGEVCSRCGCKIQQVRIGGRSSCYCPGCQK